MKHTNDITKEAVNLACELIAIPSRAEVDSAKPIVAFVRDWCAASGLPNRVLEVNGAPVGIAIRLPAGAGPSLCLNACIDTAPFGDEAKWRCPPMRGVVEQGRLYGRGAADSKIAAALFLLLCRDLARQSSLAAGTLHLLLDADEHSGGFLGVKEFVHSTDPLPKSAWIGYPGNLTIVAGSRGFLRGRVVVFGIAAHTGSKRRKGVNAILRAATLVRLLDDVELPKESAPEFEFGPSLSLTAIRSGGGFSVVPDTCEINLDLRLTPSVGAPALRALVEDTIRQFDRTMPGPTATRVEWLETWPPFRTRDSDPAISCLRGVAEQTFGRPIPSSVSGPSNVGNYLASLGISPMAGFGVTYDNVHAANEWCEIASILPVYETYQRAVLSYLSGAPE